MRKLLLILLCLPLIGFGQENFDLNQLKKIESKDDFIRYCIENGYEKVCEHTWHNEYARGMKYHVSERNKDCEKVQATDFAVFLNDEILLYIQEHSLEWTRQRNLVSYYDNIVSEIKKECTFYEIRDLNSDMTSLYNCSGKLIGFFVKEGIGIILKFSE